MFGEENQEVENQETENQEIDDQEIDDQENFESAEESDATVRDSEEESSQESDSNTENSEEESEQEKQTTKMTDPKKKSPDINADSTDEEIRFAVVQAGKSLTTAKRNCTRALNLLQNIIKDDPKIKENQIKGKILLQKATERIEILEDAYNTLILLGNDPDEEWNTTEDEWFRIQSAYIGWASNPDPKPGEKSPEKNPIYSVVGLNYDIRKNIKDAFTGADPRVYQSWRINWTAAQNKMTDLGYSEALQLMELKKVTKDQAHDLIKSLPEEDANLKLALETLDEVYLNKIKVAERTITDLLAAPKITNTSESVMKAYIAITTAENTLRGMNITDGERGALLFSVISESKLSNPLIKAWEEKKKEKADKGTPLGHTATQPDFNSILLQHYHLLQTYETNKKLQDGKDSKDGKEPEKQKKKEEDKKKQSSNQTYPGGYGVSKEDQRKNTKDGKPKPKKCLKCLKEGHWILDCYKLTRCKSVAERWKQLQGVNVCRNCLKGAHQTGQCKQKPQCNKCNKFHHPLLHDDVWRSGPAQKQEQDQKNVGALKSTDNNKTPILQACQAWVIAPGGEKYLTTVFLDSGSELTLIRRDLASEVGLTGKTVPFQMSVAGGGVTDKTEEKEVQFQLQSIDQKYTSQKMTAYTSKIITRDLRPVEISTGKYEHLKDVKFTEDFPRQGRQVDILVGVQYYTGLLKGEIIRGRPDEPMAIATKLGYILSGSM